MCVERVRFSEEVVMNSGFIKLEYFRLTLINFNENTYFFKIKKNNWYRKNNGIFKFLPTLPCVEPRIPSLHQPLTALPILRKCVKMPRVDILSVATKGVRSKNTYIYGERKQNIRVYHAPSIYTHAGIVETFNATVTTRVLLILIVHRV